jgi:hypothetical protein
MSQPVCEVCGGPLRDWPGLMVEYQVSVAIVPIGKKYLAILPVERSADEPDQYYRRDAEYCEACIKDAVERAL